MEVAVEKKAKKVMQKPKEYKEKFDANYHLERFRRNIDLSNRFNKRTANSDRTVLKGITDLAIQNGGYSLAPGVRKLAEITGKDVRTISKSLKRLKRMGWIDIQWNAHFLNGKASRWRINWDAAFLEDVEFMDDTEVLQEKLLWSGYCLGENARRIYRAIYLNNNGVKKKQISEVTNLGQKAVQTALTKLLDSELVIKDSRRYYIRTFESQNERQHHIEKIKAKWRVYEKITYKIQKHDTDRLLRVRNMKINTTFQQERKKLFKPTAK